MAYRHLLPCSPPPSLTGGIVGHFVCFCPYDTSGEKRPFYGVIFLLSSWEAPHVDSALIRKDNTESADQESSQGRWRGGISREQVQLRQQRCQAVARAETLTSTLSTDTTSYCTLLSFRLKLKSPKVKCWQDSNRPIHAKIPPALDPGCVSPGEPLAGPKAEIFPIIFLLSSSTDTDIIYSAYPRRQASSLLALRLPGAQQLIGWERGRKKKCWIGSGWGCR